MCSLITFGLFLALPLEIPDKNEASTLATSGRWKLRNKPPGPALGINLENPMRF